MTKYIKTYDPRTLEMLKGIGIHDNCTGVEIMFPPGDFVTVRFTTFLSDNQFHAFKGFLADKAVAIQDAE